MPREIDAVIDATLKAICPIRGIANVVQVGSAGYRKLVTTGGTPSGWAAETGSARRDRDPDVQRNRAADGRALRQPVRHRQAMLDDAQFDVEAWLAEEIATEFAKAEGSAFVARQRHQPAQGFLTATLSATGDASRAFGSLQYVPSGAAGDFAANPQDKLIDLVQTPAGAVPPGRELGDERDDAGADPQVQDQRRRVPVDPGARGRAAGDPARLSGGRERGHARHRRQRAVDRVRQFQGGVSDRRAQETAILRDPYSNKPFVNFYATAALDIAVQPVVEAVGVDTPPVAPLPGQCWIVGDAPTGVWSGQASALAGWTPSGWRFVGAGGVDRRGGGQRTDGAARRQRLDRGGSGGGAGRDRWDSGT